MHTLHDPHAFDTLAKFVRALCTSFASNVFYLYLNQLLTCMTWYVFTFLYSDIKFIVGEDRTTIYAHKSILATRLVWGLPYILLHG